MAERREAKAHSAAREPDTGAGERWQRSWSREEFRRWLIASCEEQGIPVVVTDPAVVRDVVALLGGPVSAGRRARPGRGARRR